MHTLISVFLATLIAATPAARPYGRLETIAREFVANFNASKFKAAGKDFNEQLAGMVTPAVFADVKRQVDAQSGTFRSISAAREYRHENSRAVELLGKHDRGMVAYRVVFDQFQRVAAIYVDPVKAQFDAALERTARDFVTNFTAMRWDLASKSFTNALRGQLTTEKLAELSRNVVMQYGAFQSIAEATPSLDGDLRTVTVKTIYASSPVDVRLTFDSKGAIAAVRLAPSTAPAK
jgi:hypothetical protein